MSAGDTTKDYYSMKFFKATGLSLLVCAAALAQNAALMPMPKIQFTDQNGAPLAGGYLYTCQAGLSCTPGTVGSAPLNPLATYTDSTGLIANQNPIVLDAAGRANVWLGSGSYKLVLQDQYGATVWTQDNVSSTSMKSVTVTSGNATAFTFTAAGSGAVSRTVSVKLGEILSAGDFGAKCDGTTDDSISLQAAINASIAANASLVIPNSANGCKFTQTLNLNVGAVSAKITGQGATGQIARLAYCGTGNALSYKNGTTGWVYSPHLYHLEITSECGAAAAAIYGQNVSEGDFSDFAIFSGAGTFTAGVLGPGWNITTFDRWRINNTSYAFDLQDSAQSGLAGNNFLNGNAYQTTASVFRLSGFINALKFANNWYEVNDNVWRLDDSIAGNGYMSSVGIKSYGDHVLNYGAPASYPNQTVLQVSGTNAAHATLADMQIDGLSAVWLTPASTSKPFKILAVGAATSNIALKIVDGNIQGIQPGGYLISSAATLTSEVNAAVVDTVAIDSNTANLAMLFGPGYYATMQRSGNAYKFNGVSAPGIAIGGSPSAGIGLYGSQAFSGTSQYGIDANFTFSGSSGNLNFGSYPNIAAGTAVSNFYHFFANAPSLGSGATIANNIAYYVPTGFTGGTANYGFYVADTNAGNYVGGTFTSGSTVNAVAGYKYNGTAGLTVVKNVTGSTGTACTLTFSGGILTASTCP